MTQKNQIRNNKDMPIYEYICERCHLTFELLKSWSELKKAEICPYCESNETRRIWSIPAIIASHNERRESEDSATLPAIPLGNSTGIRVDKSIGLTMENCTFQNLGTAMQLDNSEVQGRDIKLLDNKKGIVSKHSKVDMKGLTISHSKLSISHKEGSQT